MLYLKHCTKGLVRLLSEVLATHFLAVDGHFFAQMPSLLFYRQIARSAERLLKIGACRSLEWF